MILGFGWFDLAWLWLGLAAGCCACCVRTMEWCGDWFPTTVLMVLFDCVVVVVLTAHPCSLVCVLPVCLLHKLWICSEFESYFYQFTFYFAGETCRSLLFI